MSQKCHFCLFFLMLLKVLFTVCFVVFWMNLCCLFAVLFVFFCCFFGYLYALWRSFCCLPFLLLFHPRAGLAHLLLVILHLTAPISFQNDASLSLFFEAFFVPFLSLFVCLFHALFVPCVCLLCALFVPFLCLFCAFFEAFFVPFICPFWCFWASQKWL